MPESRILTTDYDSDRSSAQASGLGPPSNESAKSFLNEHAPIVVSILDDDVYMAENPFIV